MLITPSENKLICFLSGACTKSEIAVPYPNGASNATQTQFCVFQSKCSSEFPLDMLHILFPCVMAKQDIKYFTFYETQN